MRKTGLCFKKSCRAAMSSSGSYYSLLVNINQHRLTSTKRYQTKCMISSNILSFCIQVFSWVGLINYLAAGPLNIENS